ncbi:MAG: Gfo/Idh/MocA family oxidoreductase [Verrucomicrobiota bacterium]
MKKIPLQTGLNRRQFLTRTGAALVLPAIVPSSVLGLGDKPAPSNRITMGVVGWGMQGPGNTRSFLGQNDCQVVACCDLDKNHLESALNTVNDHYGNKDCRSYHDYREMMASKDIDAVMLAVPDHWHELVSVEALKNGKDVYGEKPLAKTIAEQQRIVQAVQKHKRIWQTGSWQRSVGNFHKGAELVRNGYIGKVTRVEVGLPSGHNDFAKTKQFMDVTPPPPELDYEMWIGPSQMQPYIKGRVHMNWRWNYNTGGGQLLDWIGHHCDIAHWGLGFDNSGPSEIEGHGDFPDKDAAWNTCTKYRIELKYPEDITMVIAGGHSDIRGGTKWIGTEGWVWVNRGGEDRPGFESSNPDWSDFKDLPDDMRKIKLIRSRNHQRNFLDSIKSRQPTITPVETAHHSAIPGHLGLISMLVGRKIRWDVKREKILHDADATKLMTRGYRAPWKMA